MSAAINERCKRALVVARDHNRLASELHRSIIAFVGNLVLAPNDDPVPHKQDVLLGLEYLRRVVHVPRQVTGLIKVREARR